VIGFFLTGNNKVRAADHLKAAKALSRRKPPP